MTMGPSRMRALSRSALLVFRAAWLVVQLTLDRVMPRPPNERLNVRTERRLGRWARQTARSIGMRVHVDGELPQGPVAIVANHLSYIDIVALWCLVPGVFVARADVATWPLIGRAGRLIDTIFIDRTRKRDLLRVLPEMQAALAAGRNVIFFPEGTSSRGEHVLPFKSPLFEAAVREGVPVVGASLQFETAEPAPSADLSVAWWADMTFAPHVFALLHFPGFEARIRFSEQIWATPELEPPGERSLAYGENVEQPIGNEAARGTASSPEGSHQEAKGSHPQKRPRRPSNRSSRERKQLCRLAYEAVEKKFIPTTPIDSTEPTDLLRTNPRAQSRNPDRLNPNGANGSERPR